MNDRDKVILWARETMEKDFIVFDTETTGLSPVNGDEAVSIGLVSKDGNVLMDTLLRHKKRSDPRALEAHGHTWEETRSAPELAEIMTEFDRIINGKEILCYCVGNFDANIFLATCLAHCVPTYDIRRRTIQALEPFAMFYGEWSRGNYRWQSLTTAARFFDIDTAGAHGAVADCLMTLRVVEAMAAWSLSGEK